MALPPDRLLTIADPFRKISPIRDPIHNYVSFTLFEREIIDSPFFQRLHFVLQNSAAYSTYPSNKNSRYIHSLGVSHLCGRIFVHGLKNAPPPVFERFLRDATTFIESNLHRQNISPGQFADVESAWRKLVNNASRFLHNPPGGDSVNMATLKVGNHFKDPLFAINTLWLALKICGLVHDIGHLPMSHLFEDALDELEDIAETLSLSSENRDAISKLRRIAPSEAIAPTRLLNQSSSAEWLEDIGRFLGIDESLVRDFISGSKLHEVRSLRIFDIIRHHKPTIYFSRKNQDAYVEGADVYRELVFFIASSILFASKDKVKTKNSFLAALRSIVASELDADRLDYTIRDPECSGLELGVFDLDRIVSSFVLVEAGGELCFAISEKAGAAIDSFYHQRYLMYSTLVYHRTAVRTKAVLREAIGRLLIYATCYPAHEVSGILSRGGWVSITGSRGNETVSQLVPSDIQHLISFDDARLRSTLFEVWEHWGATDCSDEELNRIGVMIETFLFRRSENVVSFGKGSISAENDREALLIEDVNPFTIDYDRNRVRIKAAIQEEKKRLFEATSGRVTMLFSALSPKIYRGDDPQRPDKQVLVAVDNGGTTRPLEKISPYIATQRQLAEKERDFAISFVGENLRGGGGRRTLSGRLP